MIPAEAYQQISFENQTIFVTTVKAWAGNIYKAKTRSKPNDKIVVDSTEIQSDHPVTESEGSEPDSEPDHSIETVNSIETIETTEIKNLKYPVINSSQDYFIMKPVE